MSLKDIAERRRGMTCLELLAASAISSMLMASLLSVTGMVGREQRRPSASATLDAPVQVEDLLRWDITQASFVSYSPGRLALRSYSGLDWQTLGPTHRPVEVTYEITELAGKSWLVRRQVDLDNLSSEGQRAVPICQGISGLSVRLLEELPLKASDATAAPQRPEWRWREASGGGRWEEAPRGVEVVLSLANSGAAQPRRVLALR